MLKIRYSTKFKKDYKMIVKRGYNPKLLENVLNILCTEQPLPSKYKDHQLSGNYEGHRECHISPDWLLIYKIEQSILTLTLTRTGTHSDLF
ncbi:MAG: type II toxin-antitoxin system YafQ family toxin [Lachnospiraceae bacterium]|nr:type II toxin-antitoxin system YafQ family toxin [Lachnospiraceae bacterium]